MKQLITPRVASDIQRQSHRLGRDRTLALLHQRTEKGIQDYGQPLRTRDGHNFLKHLIEELLDACQYIQGELMEGDLTGQERSQLQRIYGELIAASLTVEEMRMNREDKTHV